MKSLGKNKLKPKTAVILGAGFSGLLAAEALSKRFDKVIVIERNQLSWSSPSLRSGVPQAKQFHVLLNSGLTLLEQIFPGINSELDQLGVPLVDYTKDCMLFSPLGAVPRFPSSLLIRPTERPLLDYLILERIKKNPKVEILENLHCRKLNYRDDKIESLEGMKKEELITVKGDFFLDTMGRNSFVEKWYKSKGIIESKHVQTIDPFLGYSTQKFLRPKGYNPNWRAIEVASRPPDNPRASGLWDIGNGQWMVALIGVSKCYPPRRPEEFLNYAKELENPLIYEELKKATPIGPLHHFRGAKNRWIHYEKVKGLPSNFLSIGDSVCTFNPTYGQGMSLVLKEVSLLSSRLSKLSTIEDKDLSNLSKYMRKKIPKLIAPAWFLASCEDFNWPMTEGKRSNLTLKVSHYFMDKLAPIAPYSKELVEAFLSVANLVKSPAALAHPIIIKQFITYKLLGAPKNNETF